MEEEDLDILIKAIVVGNGAVGKSSMTQRYCNGVYTDDYKKTIGVDFLEKQLDVDSEQISLMLWDTAGQEEYDAITRAYYRGADVCVLAFSTVDRASFQAIESWKNKVEAECGPIIMILVQNKIDLVEQASVSTDEVEALARRLKLRLFRTSVKLNYNVSPVFEYLVKKYLEKRKSEAKLICNTENEDGSASKPSLGVFFGNTGETQNNTGGVTPISATTPARRRENSSFRINPGKQKTRKRSFCQIL